MLLLVLLALLALGQGRERYPAYARTQGARQVGDLFFFFFAFPVPRLRSFEIAL